MESIVAGVDAGGSLIAVALINKADGKVLELHRGAVRPVQRQIWPLSLLPVFIIAPSRKRKVLCGSHCRPLGKTEGNHRVTCIDKLFFDEAGNIRQVK